MMRVHQLIDRRGDRGEDSEPAEWILAAERRQHTGRDRVAAHAVEPVAAGDDVALEVDAVVHDPLAVHALADPCVAQQVGRSLLEHARPNPLLDVLSAAILDDDGLDSCNLEQAGERQAGRPRAHDPDLRARRLQSPSSSRTRWNTLNALFAAGTPQ